jgi:hypothetical protein
VRISQSGVRSYKRCRVHSKWETLVQHLRCLSQRIGLQLALSEDRSCLGRIRLRWRTRRDPLFFQKVRESCPALDLTGEENRTEMNPYTRGIQALNAHRTLMSLEDTELYLQGWFQAQAVFSRTMNTEHQRMEVEVPSIRKARQSYAAPSSSAIDHT